MARRFQFRLATLLRVRELREQDAQRKVAAQCAAIARLDQLDTEAEHLIRVQQEVLLTTQRAGVLDPAQLQRGRAWVVHLRRMMAQRAAQRADLEQELKRLRDEFHAARKETRILEKLRERRLTEHTRTMAREEQMTADELARQLHVGAPT